MITYTWIWINTCWPDKNDSVFVHEMFEMFWKCVFSAVLNRKPNVWGKMWCTITKPDDNFGDETALHFCARWIHPLFAFEDNDAYMRWLQRSFFMLRFWIYVDMSVCIPITFVITVMQPSSDEFAWAAPVDSIFWFISTIFVLMTWLVVSRIRLSQMAHFHVLRLTLVFL